MPTFGQAPSFSSYNFVDSLGGSNQVASGLLTFNANGWITSVTVFVDGDTSSNTLNACVWNSGGGLIQSGGFASGTGSRFAGGQHWHTIGLTGFFLGNGSQCYIGWTKANSGGNYVWSNGGGGAGGVATGGNPGSLGGLSGFPSGLGGQVGAYFTYTTVVAPTCNTNAASSVLVTSATLNGDSDPGGLVTTVSFQWGTTTGYGNVTAGSNIGSNGSDPGDTAFSTGLSGLTSNTTYHYRAVASNAAGTTYGADQQFTTVGTPNPPTLTAPTNNVFSSDWQNGETFTWTYNPVTGSGETGYYLQVTPAGGVANWWTGAAWTTTETQVVTASLTVTISAANMQTLLGNPGNVLTYTWTVASQDNIGKGSYAAVFTVNNEIPPAVPGLQAPANATYADLAGTPTFSWVYNPTNGDSGQLNYAIRRKLSGAGSYSYWNAGSTSWQGTIVWNASSSQSYTFPAAQWTDGGPNTYNWSVATQDDGGQGLFASDFTVNAQAAPIVSVTAPTGSTSSSKPFVLWSATLPGGVSQTNYRIRTFTSAQYGAGGFNPAISASTDDSTFLSGATTSYQVGTLLPIGAYRSYANITETGGENNAFNAFTGYTVVVDTPNAPTLTATAMTDPVTGCPLIQLQAQCEINLLSAVDSSFESGVGTFAATLNCSLSQSATQFLDGTFSLRMSSTAAGRMDAGSAQTYAVSPSTQYTAVASFRAGVTVETVKVYIYWYQSGGGASSHPNDASIGATDTTSGWTQQTITATAPADAAFAQIVVSVNSTAGAAELHYVDNVGIFPGTNTAWSLGGFLTTAGVAILRSDGLYVRYASLSTLANLLPTGGTGNPNATISQLVTVNDYEATGLQPYTYTAQIQAVNVITAGTVLSPASAPAGATVSFNGFWELDPTAPSTAINAQPITWNPQQYEQGMAHVVLGQVTPNYVSYVMQNQDFTATFETFKTGIFNALLAIITSQKTVFINAPYGFSGYFRLAPSPGGGGGGSGSKAHDSQLLPSTASGPHYTLNVTGVSQPRPAV